MLKKLFKNQKGFTLIEILVVIVIIGILFTVILPRIDFAGDKARQTGVKTDFRTFTVSAEQYFRESAGNNLTYEGFNSYLDDSNRIVATGTVGTTITKYATAKKDPWGSAYQTIASDLTGTTGQIIFTSIGKKGGALSSFAAQGAAGNTSDYTLAIYYRSGTIETCTSGFGDADIKLASLATFVPSGCGAQINP